MGCSRKPTQIFIHAGCQAWVNFGFLLASAPTCQLSSRYMVFFRVLFQTNQLNGTIRVTIESFEFILFWTGLFTVSSTFSDFLLTIYPPFFACTGHDLWTTPIHRHRLKFISKFIHFSYSFFAGKMSFGTLFNRKNYTLFLLFFCIKIFTFSFWQCGNPNFGSISLEFWIRKFYEWTIDIFCHALVTLV